MQTIIVTISPVLATIENAAMLIIHSIDEKIFNVIAVPKVSPSRSGCLSISCTNIARNPNCIIGNTKATRDAA